ncbi:MAG TPA: DNA mismatch repair protein MutS, partial [Bacillota bacterium]|nr:DNA mismatch repair protein MutS [Bacillota bacterium]
KKTPMIEQYLEIKKQYQDCILFFRLGDFYEMFFEDAIIASRDLEIVLTGRDSGEERIPMCGVPFHSVSGYLSKLLSKGHKVAICEQVEDPKAVKGIVKREVVRVITPGTVIEEQLLNEKTNNYLLAITSTNQSLGLAHVDISTSEFRATQIGKNQLPLLSAEIIRIRPAEIYLAAAVEKELSAVLSFEQSTVSIGEEHFFHYDNAYECLKEHFKLSNLHSFGLEGMEAATIAAGAILQYLQETQKNSLLHLRKINTYQIGDFMALDPATRRNLELTRTARSNEIQGSLLGVLDLTVTAMGSRKLRNWIEQPLTNLDAINERQAAIADLTHSLEVRETLRESLKKTYDLQRILSKLSSNSANARDLLALR